LRLLPEGVISQNGDCYCDSITFCLGQWTEDDGTEARDTASQAFRKETVDWLQRQSPEFVEFRDGWKIKDLLFDDEPLGAFATRMNKPQEWFEGAAVMATVEISKRELILISTLDREDYVLHFRPRGDERKGPPIVLGYWFGKHFEPALDSLESKRVKGGTIEPVDAMRKAKKTYGKKTSKRKHNDEYEFLDSMDDEEDDDEEEPTRKRQRKGKRIIDTESDEEDSEDFEEEKSVCANFEELSKSPFVDQLFVIAIADIWEFREFDRWTQPKRGSPSDSQKLCMELAEDIRENGQHDAIVITCSPVKKGGMIWQGAVVEGNHRLRGLIQVGEKYVIARLVHGAPGDKRAKAKFPGRFKFPNKRHEKPECHHLFGNDKVYNVPWPEKYLA
jgi:hypothetical protein